MDRWMTKGDDPGGFEFHRGAELVGFAFGRAREADLTLEDRYVFAVLEATREGARVQLWRARGDVPAAADGWATLQLGDRVTHGGFSVHFLRMRRQDEGAEAPSLPQFDVRTTDGNTCRGGDYPKSFPNTVESKCDGAGADVRFTVQSATDEGDPRKARFRLRAEPVDHDTPVLFTDTLAQGKFRFTDGLRAYINATSVVAHDSAGRYTPHTYLEVELVKGSETWTIRFDTMRSERSHGYVVTLDAAGVHISPAK
jgi:hypothetical protein